MKIVLNRRLVLTVDLSNCNIWFSTFLLCCELLPFWLTLSLPCVTIINFPKIVVCIHSGIPIFWFHLQFIFFTRQWFKSFEVMFVFEQCFFFFFFFSFFFCWKMWHRELSEVGKCGNRRIKENTLWFLFGASKLPASLSNPY